ncbi:MAG: isochorismatase family protein [Phenylobacterium sp.]|uniref:isochorismatase family protein n=1 Tax=Phenylobacterium sp. TaxID=1871053 RepID=UPI00391DB4C3
MSGRPVSLLGARPRLLLCLDLLTPPSASDVEAVSPVFVANCRRVLDHARGAGWPVVHVHAAASFGAGARAIDGLELLPSEPLYHRLGVSAFSSPEFRGLVRANPQAELIIVGASLDSTCLATALAAFDRGMAAALVSDAVSVSPKEREGLDGLEQIVRALAAPFVRFVSTDVLVGRARKFAVIDGGGAPKARVAP